MGDRERGIEYLHAIRAAVAGQAVAETVEYLSALGPDGNGPELVLERLVLEQALGLDLQLNRVGAMMTLFFCEDPVWNYDGACRCDQGMFARYFRAMLDQGIYLAPSQFEAAFVSAAHDRTHLQKMLNMTESSFKKLVDL